MVVSLLLADLKLDPSLGVRLRLSTCGEEPRIWTECWCYTGYEARPPHTVHSHTGLVHPATHSGSALASPLNTPTSTLCLYISTYRVSHIIGPTLFFAIFQIGTRILKIDLEIAEIIDVKIATYNTKIIFLPLRNSKMSTSKWQVPSLTSIISAISKSIFKILVPIW